MKHHLRSMTLTITALLIVIWSAPCHAAESTFKDIFTDSLYGGLTGSLVGAAVMVFARKPLEHLDYIGYGAAAGVLVGAAVGTGRALMEIENGRVRLSMPTVIPDLQDTNSKGQTPLVITAQLLRGKF